MREWDKERARSRRAGRKGEINLEYFKGRDGER